MRGHGHTFTPEQWAALSDEEIADLFIHHGYDEIAIIDAAYEARKDRRRQRWYRLKRILAWTTCLLAIAITLLVR